MTNRAISIPAFDGGRGEMPAATSETATVLLVTGISGAGKTSALKALEDMGFEAVDNVPLSLLGSLVLPGQRSLGAHGLERPIAIGVDIRTRDFGVDTVLRELDQLTDEDDIEVKVLFLDCDDEELSRRFAVTRHRHPLAGDRPLQDGIDHERRLVSRLRDRADLAVDTTGLAPGDLKRILHGHFAGAVSVLSVFVTSFSYRQGLPREADLVFDVRFLANPHYDPALRPLTGRDGAVADFIAADPGFDAFFEGLTGMLLPLLPRYTAEGKSALTIAVGCTGGRHRSVLVAEKLAAWLAEREQRVSVRHRDLGDGAP
jgi:RNase adapter protein RapZ